MHVDIAAAFDEEGLERFGDLGDLVVEGLGGKNCRKDSEEQQGSHKLRV